MCILKPLIKGACLSNSPGLIENGWVAPSSEFATWPAFLSTTAPGDSVKLSGNFDFSGAGTGKGYFRRFPTLMEKGAIVKRPVGDIASKTFEQIYTFYIPGADAIELEFLKSVLNVPSVYVVKDKNGTVHVLGSKEEPAYLQEAEQNTGTTATDPRGTAYTIRHVTGNPAIYTGTINETPIT